MAGFKVTRFYGEIPRVADELLPTSEQQGVNYASRSVNAKFDSGNLKPIRVPLEVYDHPDANEEIGTMRKIQALDFSNVEDIWLTWDTDVDLIIGTQADLDFKYNGNFFYITNEDPNEYPKMSYGDLLVGYESADPDADYPKATADRYGISTPTQFALGIPAPDDALTPTAQVQAFSPKQTQGFERDSSNFATVTTQAPHGLRTGNLVSIDGFGERNITGPIVVPPVDPDPEQPEQEE